MKTLCLFNPLAHKAHGNLLALFKGREYWGDVFPYVLYPDDLTDPGWVKHLDDAEKVIILGGDGTLHHVAQFLVHRDIAVHVLPVGTANDLCRWIGLGPNLLQNIIALETGKTISYDVIKANHRYVLSGGGFGLGYLVAEQVHILSNSKRGKVFRTLMGPNLYTFLILWNIAKNPIENYSYKCRIGDSLQRINTPGLIFTNQAMFGKGIVLAPGTKSTDGQFHLVIFRNTKRTSILYTLSSIKLKLKRNDPNLYRMELKKITLIWQSPVPAFADGELLPSEMAWEIQCHAGALKLRVPATFHEDVDT